MSIELYDNILSQLNKDKSEVGKKCAREIRAAQKKKNKKVQKLESIAFEKFIEQGGISFNNYAELVEWTHKYINCDGSNSGSFMDKAVRWVIEQHKDIRYEFLEELSKDFDKLLLEIREVDDYYKILKICYRDADNNNIIYFWPGNLPMLETFENYNLENGEFTIKCSRILCDDALELARRKDGVNFKMNHYDESIFDSDTYTFKVKR